MDAIRNIKTVINNWETCSKWEKEQDDRDLRYSIFKDTIPAKDKNISLCKNRGKTLTHAINIMDQISINKSENALVGIRTALHGAITAISTVGLIGGYAISKILKHRNPKTTAFISYALMTLLGSSVGCFIDAYCAKTSTRIARYQTRNNEMQDFRNFVVYTDEQIEMAKKKLSSIKDVKDLTEDMTLKESLNPLNVYAKSFETVKSLKKEYKQYLNWRKNYAKTENDNQKILKQINITAEEKSKAEKDKNFVLRTIKKLEIASNKYEINTAFAVKVFACVMSVIALAGSFLASWALNKTSCNMKSGKFAALLNYTSKATIPLGIVSMAFLAGPLSKLSKDSAKLGRFKETEKLLAEKKNFYPHTDKDIENVKFISKHKRKTKWDIVKDNFKFIFGIKGDYKEYLKYKKERQQTALKLREILKTMPITTEQLKEAKRLQKQTFMAFEKIDDKSECLVDDITAAVAVGTNLINGIACTLANILTLKLFGKQISKYTKTKSMPDFFEGLKLTKHLSLKQMSLIFVAPFLVTRGIILLTSLLGTEIKKKACKIGVMSAMNELNDPRKFINKEPIIHIG